VTLQQLPKDFACPETGGDSSAVDLEDDLEIGCSVESRYLFSDSLKETALRSVDLEVVDVVSRRLAELRYCHLSGQFLRGW